MTNRGHPLTSDFLFFVPFWRAYLAYLWPCKSDHNTIPKWGMQVFRSRHSVWYWAALFSWRSSATCNHLSSFMVDYIILAHAGMEITILRITFAMSPPWIPLLNACDLCLLPHIPRSYLFFDPCHNLCRLSFHCLQIMLRFTCKPMKSWIKVAWASQYLALHALWA